MNNKWQTFIFGILTGLFISGIVFLISTSINQQNFIKESSLNLIGNSNSSARQSLPSSVTPVITPGISISHPFELTSKIELNSATLEELSTLPGIGAAKAQNIIDFREKYGNFADIRELLYVPGIGESIFSQIKDLVFLSSTKE